MLPRASRTVLNDCSMDFLWFSMIFWKSLPGQSFDMLCSEFLNKMPSMACLEMVSCPLPEDWVGTDFKLKQDIDQCKSDTAIWYRCDADWQTDPSSLMFTSHILNDEMDNPLAQGPQRPSRGSSFINHTVNGCWGIFGLVMAQKVPKIDPWSILAPKILRLHGTFFWPIHVTFWREPLVERPPKCLVGAMSSDRRRDYGEYSFQLSIL